MFGQIFLCQMCRALLNHGCAVNYLSKTGESPLHIMTKRGRFEAAMVLLTHGANANLKSLDGNTALHLAMKACVRIFSVLIFPTVHHSSCSEEVQNTKHDMGFKVPCSVGIRLHHKSARINFIDQRGVS